VTLLLVGAGGHAKAIVEALEANGKTIAAYADPQTQNWIDARRVDGDDAALALPKGEVVIGVGGMKGEDLARRLELLETYLDAGWNAIPLVHPSATVSKTANLAIGAIVLAGAIVQPGTRIGRGAIVNTGAIVEHDSVVGDGAHIGPGAIVLGGCSVGGTAMVGAGAVVLPLAEIAAGALVPSMGRFPS